MNNRILSFVLALACASLLLAHAQEPPGCTTKSSTKKHLKTASAQRSEISGKLPKRRVLDLRKHKPASRDEQQAQAIPVIASPIYLPQTGASGTAITASNGYLYVVVGQKLYKVNEKTLKTIQVSQLGRTVEETSDSESPKRKHKLVASAEDEPRHATATKKRRASKAD